MAHPADLDDALCASALVGASGGGEEGATRLPFAVGSALLCGFVVELWAVSGPALPRLGLVQALNTIVCVRIRARRSRVPERYRWCWVRMRF